MSSKKAKKTKKTNKINKTKKVKIKHLPEIILVVSALLLGMLIVILVWKGKTTQIIEPERVIQGSFPTPAELVEEDKLTYFAYMDVPDMIFKKMDGVTFNEDCPVAREDLCYMKVLYWGIDKEAHQGELIVNKAIAPDLVDIFYRLYKASYPIGKIELVENYGGNDEVSMSNNNTSGFNGRKVAGSDSWSMHAYGLAIDLNPLYNPYVGSGGTVLPIAGEAYANRDDNFLYKIDENDYAYKLFIEHGFTWGGSWSNSKDYQHFEKNIEE